MRPLLFLFICGLGLALWLGFRAFQSDDGSALHLPDDRAMDREEAWNDGTSPRVLPERVLSSDLWTADESEKSASKPFHPNASIDSLLFRFLSEESRKPVPGVRVYFLGEVPEDSEARFFTQFIMEKGEVFVADDQGELRLPRGSKLGHLLAMGSGLWAETVILPIARGPLDEPAQVFLKKIEVVQVRALTNEGKPLESLPLVWKAQVTRGRSQILLRMKTDKEGWVVMPIPEETTRGTVLSETIEVEGLFPEPIFLTMDRKNLSTTPLELRLPDCSVLQFEIVSPDELRRANAEVLIALGQDLNLQELNARGLCIHIVDGEASFPWVGPGLPLTIQAGVDFRLGYQRLDLQIQTAAQSGGMRRVELRFDPSTRDPYIHGTLRGPRGEVLSDLKDVQFGYRWTEGTQGNSCSSGPLALDDEGKFGFRLGTELRDDYAHHFQIEVPNWRGFPLSWDGQVVPAANGDVDLGTIRLQEVPVVAGGRVVDAKGQGIAGASVIVSERSQEARGEGRAPSHITGGTTGAKGQFRLHALVPSDELTLTVIAGDYGTLEQDFRSGATDMLLQIKPKCRLRVLVMAANRESLFGLSYQLTSVQGPVLSSSLPDDGLLRLPLEPGVYHFRLFDRFDPDSTLFEARDLELFPGSTKNLGTMKLNRKLRKLAVEVQGLELLSNADRQKVEIIATDLATAKTVGQSSLAPAGAETSILVSSPEVQLSVTFGNRRSPPLRETSPKTILTLPQ